MPHNHALEAHEHAGHAEHAAHEADSFISRVSITIAVLAVLASAVGSLETVEAGKAITASSEAVLYQDQATDAWAEYQSDSIKKHIYDAISATAAAPAVADLRRQSSAQGAKQGAVRARAQKEEAERDRLLKASAAHEERHHWLTAAATLFEIGIALSTVAIVTRLRSFWAFSVLMGLAGSALFAVAYLA